MTVSFPVTVMDDNGATVTVNVPITFTGTNDVPTISTTSRTVYLNEGGGNARFTNPTTGTLVDNNPASGTDNGFNGTTHTVLVGSSAVTGNTSQTFNFSDADRTDVSHTASVGSVTIATSNPAANVAAAAPSEATVLGWLTVSDVDRTLGGTGRIDWTFAAPDSAFNFLADGEMLTLTYQLQVSDGSLTSTAPLAR